MMVRLIHQGEEEACNTFHNQYYHTRRTLDQWSWEFVPRQFPTPPLPIAVAVDQDRVVGTQALIPIRMIDSDGSYWAAKSEETLIDPGYRGKDLSTKLYQVVFEYAEQRGMAYVWGFTTATKPLQKAGFEVPSRVSQLFFPFSARAVRVLFSNELADGPRKGPRRAVKQALAAAACGAARAISEPQLAVARIKLRARSQAEMEVRALTSPPPECAEITQRFVSQWGGTTILRDEEYLRWRIFENPWVRSAVRGIYLGGRLQGWIAFCLGDDGMGYLVDVMVAPNESNSRTAESLVRALLSESVVATRRMGAVGLRAWHVNSHPFDQLVARVARNLGFFRFKRGMSVVRYTTSHGRSRGGADRAGEWYINRLWSEGLMG